MLKVLEKNDIKNIVIHRSKSPHGRGDNAETINRWHIERGFDMCGYHYVILEDGTIEKARPDFIEGAHCSAKGFNKKSLGICMIGLDSFTAAQLNSCYRLCRSLLNKYGLVSDDIVGHDEIDNTKVCPNTDMNLFRYNVKEDICLL